MSGSPRRWRHTTTARRPNKPSGPREPDHLRILVDDTTVEGLWPILKENPRGVVWQCDEGSTLFGGLNQYKASGKGSDRGNIMKLWNGKTIRIDRIYKGTRGSVRPYPARCIAANMVPSQLIAVGAGTRTASPSGSSRSTPTNAPTWTSRTAR